MAMHIFDRLREEYDFDGGYTIATKYVYEHRRRTGEMFVLLSHPAGCKQPFPHQWRPCHPSFSSGGHEKAVVKYSGIRESSTPGGEQCP